MVVDSSAAIAILLKEPGWQVLREALLEAGRAVMSAANLLEADMVMRGRLGEGGSIDLDRLVSEAGIEIVAFDAAQAAIARDAFRRFGKRLHPAGLNFATASPMRSPRRWASPYCSSAMISLAPTSCRLWHRKRPVRLDRRVAMVESRRRRMIEVKAQGTGI